MQESSRRFSRMLTFPRRVSNVSRTTKTKSREKTTPICSTFSAPTISSAAEYTVSESWSRTRCRQVTNQTGKQSESPASRERSSHSPPKDNNKQKSSTSCRSNRKDVLLFYNKINVSLLPQARLRKALCASESARRRPLHLRREFQPQLRRGVLPLRRRRTARLPGIPVHCAPRS